MGGRLDALLGRHSGSERRSISYQDWWGSGADFAGNSTTSGVNITTESALCFSAVYGAVRILSEGSSKLPVCAFRGADQWDQVAVPRWVEEPDPTLPHIGTPEVIDQVMVSLLLRGNGYVATIRDDLGNILALQVLNPDKVTPYLDGNRRLRYRVEDAVFTPFEIAHIIGLSKPGEITGMSVLDYAKETIGLGLAATQFGAGFFGNGATPSGLITVDEEISEEGLALLRTSWKQLLSGKKGAGLAVLSEGAKFEQLTITPENAQFLETRGFQIADVARFFGVPPHLLQDASGSTSWGSGLAEQSTNYVTHSLRPWVERIEAWLTRMARSEAPGVTARARRISIKLSMDHLLRGDYASQIDTYGKALLNGIYTLNEVRSFLNAPPVADGSGDTHRVPLNTAPSDEAGGDTDPPPEGEGDE